MKQKSVITVVFAVVVCLALVLSFFLGRTSVAHEKKPAIPTATLQETTAVPTETPTPTVTEESTLEPTLTPSKSPELPSKPIPSISAIEEAEEASKVLEYFFDSYKVQEFVKTEGEKHTYYTYSIQLYTDNADLQFVQVVIMSEKNDFEIKEIFLEHTDDMLYVWFSGNYQPVIEEDVDFDGDKDVLILCGGYRNQYYQCYLNDGWYYEVMPAFSHILNPEIDAELQGIRGYAKDGAVSHSGTVYQYIDGKLEIVEQMTEIFYIEDENGKIKDWESSYWVVEKRIDGKLVITDTFSEEGMTEAEKEDLRETLRTFDSYYSLYSK